MRTGEEFGETRGLPVPWQTARDNKTSGRACPELVLGFQVPRGGCLASRLRHVLDKLLFWSRFCFGLPDALKSGNYF